VKTDFEVATWLYRKGMSVVRYDEQKASRIYTLFPAKNFAAVNKYFEKILGPATENSEKQVRRIGNEAASNTVIRWVSVARDSDQTNVLEMRKFDDIRGMLPDMAVGVLRLYSTGTPPMFRYLSDSDLVLHNLKLGVTSAP
jgi:hypothetical protein